MIGFLAFLVQKSWPKKQNLGKILLTHTCFFNPNLCRYVSHWEKIQVSCWTRSCCI